MKTLNDYFIEYEDSHQNPINKRIHYFCVPLILFSSLGIMKALPVPSSWPLWFDLSVVFMILSNLYLFYFKNWRVVLSFAIVLILMTFILELLRPRFFILSLLVFIICWIGQFIGHHIEGKKTKFFERSFFSVNRSYLGDQ